MTASDRDEATGIAEEVVSTENDLEQEQREVTRLEREVTVIDLLIDALIEAENDARNQYLEPVLQNVLPYLQRLFPDSAIGIDNNVNITEVTRDASRVEPSCKPEHGHARTDRSSRALGVWPNCCQKRGRP